MESIETLNQRLIDHFGLDNDTSRPIFRIVWSDDMIEKRMVDVTEQGIQYLFPVMQEMKKYSYVKHMYILERLVVVPYENQDELLGKMLSYEPIWVYCDGNKNPVPPIWDATKFIIDTLYAALGHSDLTKYVDSEKNTTVEGREARIKELQEELFGNETETADALRYKQGVVVPNSYEVN